MLALELLGVTQEHGKVYIRHLGGACFRTGGVLHRSMERCTSDTWEVLALELVGGAWKVHIRQLWGVVQG